MGKNERSALGRQSPESTGSGLEGVDALVRAALTGDPDDPALRGGLPGCGMTKISPFVPGAPYGLEHMSRGDDGSGGTVRVAAAPLPKKVPHLGPEGQDSAPRTLRPFDEEMVRSRRNEQTVLPDGTLVLPKDARVTIVRGNMPPQKDILTAGMLEERARNHERPDGA